MSQDIVKEVVFLLHSFLLGVIITFVYDWFLILRRLIRHTMLLISLEDMIFWIACAIGIFYMLYEENNGILRWFAVAGATLGMLIYKKTISRYLIQGAVKVLSWLSGLLAGFFGLIFRPIRFLLKKLGKGGRFVTRKSGKIGKCLKKKLTEYGKILKITLCKR